MFTYIYGRKCAVYGQDIEWLIKNVKMNLMKMDIGVLKIEPMKSRIFSVNLINDCTTGERIVTIYKESEVII